MNNIILTKIRKNETDVIINNKYYFLLLHIYVANHLTQKFN